MPLFSLNLTRFLFLFHLACDMQNVIYSALLNYGAKLENVENLMNYFDDTSLPLVNKETKQLFGILESAEFRPYLEEELKNCIKHHNFLLDYCDLIKDFFSPILLPCTAFFLFYIIVITFVMLNVTNEAQKFPLFLYLGNTFCALYIMTYFGELITHEVSY